MDNSVITSGNNKPLNDINAFLVTANNEIIIFSPYITVKALENLKLPLGVKVSIITTLKIKDIQLGVSDIELYPYVKNNSITVYINNNIHLKVYMRDWEGIILGSSNLTQKGLGSVTNSNYELNAIIEPIQTYTIIYLRKIIAESQLMNDDIYREALEASNRIPKLEEMEEIDISKFKDDKSHLISSLPMSKDINKLYELIENDFASSDSEETNCAIHDYILYEIPKGLQYEKFKKHLSSSLFSSYFINDLLLYIDERGRYFGEVKEWIQNNCKDVPVPSRRDLTGNIQVLYRWIIELSNGEYDIDRPHYSERIYRK